MKLLHLSIRGFRSFQKDQMLSFPPEPGGFHLLTGSNDVEPELGANGAGKSTVWDALAWVLYGKTARGNRASAVACWDDRFMPSVMVHFERLGVDYRITRTWNPNSLNVSINREAPRPCTQEEVDAFVGVDYQSFLLTVLMGQFGKFFFDLSATEKLNIFSSALGLQQWDGYASKAREEAKTLDKLLTSAKMKQSQTLGKIQQTEQTIAELDRSFRDWAELHKTEIDQCQVALNTAVMLANEAADVNALSQQALVDAEAQEKAAYGTQAQYSDDLNAAQVAVRLCESELTEHVSESRQHQRDLDRIGREIRNIEQLGDKCVACQQAIGAQHKFGQLSGLKSAQAESQKKLEDAQGKEQQVKRVLSQRQAELAVVQARIREAEASARQVQAELQALRRSAADSASNVARTKANAEAVQRRLEALKASGNPHKIHLEQYKQILICTQAELAQTTVEVESTEVQHRRVSWWVGGFKDLRLWLIEEALVELRVAINNAFRALGLAGWTVEFAIEVENSSGGITRGFNVSIRCPSTEEPVPWEAWSGGETQRLRIASAIGLSTLICSRKGFHPSIEIWDEPTAYLSAEGIEDLLTFFKDRALTESRQLWLVDHRSLTFGFDSVVTVRKTIAGSLLVQTGHRP